VVDLDILGGTNTRFGDQRGEKIRYDLNKVSTGDGDLYCTLHISTCD